MHHMNAVERKYVKIVLENSTSVKCAHHLLFEILSERDTFLLKWISVANVDFQSPRFLIIGVSIHPEYAIWSTPIMCHLHLYDPAVFQCPPASVVSLSTCSSSKLHYFVLSSGISECNWQRNPRARSQSRIDSSLLTSRCTCVLQCHGSLHRLMPGCLQWQFSPHNGTQAL